MGERDPKMVLIPAMIRQPNGVTILAFETMPMALSPPPLAMHHPKTAKAAMGIVKPFTVYM